MKQTEALEIRLLEQKIETEQLRQRLLNMLMTLTDERIRKLMED